MKLKFYHPVMPLLLLILSISYGAYVIHGKVTRPKSSEKEDTYLYKRLWEQTDIIVSTRIIGYSNAQAAIDHLESSMEALKREDIRAAYHITPKDLKERFPESLHHLRRWMDNNPEKYLKYLGVTNYDPNITNHFNPETIWYISK